MCGSVEQTSFLSLDLTNLPWDVKLLILASLINQGNYYTSQVRNTLPGYYLIRIFGTKVLKLKHKQVVLGEKTLWDKHCRSLENSGSSSLVADLALLFIS